MAEAGTDDAGGGRPGRTPPELPTTFGKYFLTEKLATGGMAEIYLAKLIGPGGFEKQLVIKQIHPKLSHQRHFVDLFVAEAKTLVALAHGNIVPVYELGVVDDMYFIAMEYIDGPTLYRLTETMAGRDATMDPPVAAWITARILEGLDYAHRKGEGLIHRDLSPRNVMLSRDGEVKLVDFGIAVALGEPGETEASQSAPTGSFPYMSPEQVRREALSPLSDLFSAGVLCWEMLVGRRLFARPTPEATLAAVCDEEIPRPSSQRAEVPPKLDEIVMRALERDRDARWPSAGDMLDALNRYLYSLEATPGPRDVEALVARYCPPQTRRLPTHLEAAAQEAALAGDNSGPATHSDAPLPAGPRTAVIPRDGSSPRGKRQQRHQTFATHVDLKDMLERATPMIGVEAIVEEPPPPKETAADRRLAVAPKLGDLVQRSPSRGFLVAMGIGATLLAAGSIWLFYQGRDQVLHVTADAAPDAPKIVLPPPVRDAAIEIDAAELDAAPQAAIDAGHRERPRADAIVEMHPDSAPMVAGTATLQLGANPWAEIFVDGKKYGTTPRNVTVPAGHHTVELVFSGETPPRKQTFAVDLANGETKPLEADFK